MNRLSEETFRKLPANIAVPNYDRSALTAGIVHLGAGAFHRAHQAAYTEAAISAGDMSWGTTGVSLRSPATRDALRPQDFLYTVCVSGPEVEGFQVIGGLKSILVAPENPQVILACLCDNRVRIVSLTVTEKGYCYDPATGQLQESHPEVAHDLIKRDEPKSVLGFIVEALRRRYAARSPPFSILCCDNLPANGAMLRRLVTQFAHLRDPGLARQIERDVAFPCTMVDRIVPSTTEVDRMHVAGCLGVSDAWPVVTEPFSQWVIEDNFPSGRPRWELMGAEFVTDVAPHETLKLRLLNGSHSAIAYIGYLGGYDTVAEAMADPLIAAFIADLMDKEITPVLQVPAKADVEAYKAALLKRFRNTALKHRTWQIAMDGSQKLPLRLLATIDDRIAKGMPFDRLALVIAAWIFYVSGIDARGEPIEVKDPLAPEFRRRADAAGRDPALLAAAIVSMSTVFGHLSQNAAFLDRVTSQLALLLQHGIPTALRHTLAS
jgi:fructuronate reductase